MSLRQIVLDVDPFTADNYETANEDVRARAAEAVAAVVKEAAKQQAIADFFRIAQDISDSLTEEEKVEIEEELIRLS